VSAPVVATTRAELSAARAAMAGRVAVVMTMGAIHAGHRRLMQVAREQADSVLVTIFVNPLQFGAGEDFQRYPRDLAADLAACEQEGVDVVFAPDEAVMYPPDAELVHRDSGWLGAQFEGATRPGHFDGVLTVVAELLTLIKPDLAFFGEKDAQQLELIRRMVAERGEPVEVRSVETVREPDGLALSSRNRYLSPDERVAARSLSQALRAGAANAGRGVAAAISAARAVLAAQPMIDIDYLAAVDDRTWRDPDADTDRLRLLVAGRIGNTRLIDNVVVDRPAAGGA